MAYERLEILKESEKSRVYLVFDPENRRMLIEKHLAGELAVYQRLTALPHPYLPRLYGVCFENGETIITEEYVSGGSIGAVHTSEKQLLQWLLELCGVLRFLHRNRIIHRDIKPSNILIGADGHIRLIDFDAAREEKVGTDSDTRLLGTRGYAPPEQFGFAQTDGRADIYALGVTFRELLGETAAKPRWKGILRRCTALEPKRRYQHVWQIPLAVRLGQLRRRVLYPVLVLLLLLSVGAGVETYVAPDSRSAVDIVLSSNRELIFRDAEIRELRKSDSRLSPYFGNPSTAYDELSSAYPELTFISTGYSDEYGEALFGGFTTNYNMDTGKRYYQNFAGLYTVSRRIPPRECEDYAPAVLKLYALDVFDTPIF